MILTGDCRRSLAAFPDNFFDACITDPPYEIGFMGKSWDKSGVAFDPATWREVLRVMKPGAHLLSFGGTRTVHRVACAIEDAGFEIRDQIVYLYGSGMPKSHNVSIAIDKHLGAERPVIGSWKPTGTARIKGGQGAATSGRTAEMYRTHEVRDTLPITAPATDEAKQWDGFGTALKPACEMIVVARKPLIGTVATNVLAHGVGAMNIAATRVDGTGAAIGRWPANVVLSHLPDCEEMGPAKVRANSPRKAHKGKVSSFQRSRVMQTSGLSYGDDDGTETVTAWACADGCPVALLDAQAGLRKSGAMKASTVRAGGPSFAHGARRGNVTTADIPASNGPVSRFFYSSKVSRAERSEGLDETNGHHTVKPMGLMRWLVRLVCPPRSLVLDPFAGSGTTLCALAHEEQWGIGVELHAEQARIANLRHAYALETRRKESSQGA